MRKPLDALHVSFRQVALLIAVSLGSVCAQLAPALAGDPLTKCLTASGNLGAKCLSNGSKALEELVEPADGILVGLLQKTNPIVVKKCAADDAETLGYVHVPDVTAQINTACESFAYDLNALVYSADQAGLTEDEQACRSSVYKRVQKARKGVTTAWGKKCIVPQYKGKGCDRTKRDDKVEKIRAKAASAIESSCGADFDALGAFPGATLQDRIAGFVDAVVDRGQHYAQRVYPPNELATGEFGPFRIGVTTLALEDPSRLNLAGTGPRPLTTEVYYPTTDAAVVGLPKDTIQVFGFDIIDTPAYRDAAIAPGPFPLVAFSHGSGGIRFQSFFHTAQLATHGYVVISPDHEGNTLLNPAGDPASAVNRPLDISFLLDEFLTFNTTPGNFFEGAIDPTKIGSSGHSFGGFTNFLLAGGPSVLGTFTDPRIGAIFPMAPAAAGFTTPFLETITIPTMIVGGSLDETTPFPTDQQAPYDSLLSGASVVALAEVIDAGHQTFSDYCELPQNLIDLIGLAAPCDPEFLPWRHAHDVIAYMALNFFDATLHGDGDALSRLSPAVMDTIDDIRFESK